MQRAWKFLGVNCEHACVRVRASEGGEQTFIINQSSFVSLMAAHTPWLNDWKWAIIMGCQSSRWHPLCFLHLTGPCLPLFCTTPGVPSLITIVFFFLFFFFIMYIMTLNTCVICNPSLHQRKSFKKIYFGDIKDKGCIKYLFKYSHILEKYGLQTYWKICEE